MQPNELGRLCLRTPEVRASTLGAESVALGAIRIALDEVDARVLRTPDLGTPTPLRQ